MNHFDLVFETSQQYFEERAHGLYVTWQEGLTSSLKQFLRWHPRIVGGATLADVARAPLVEDDARLVIALEHGQKDWDALMAYVGMLDRGERTELFLEAYRALKLRDGVALERLLHRDATLARARGTNGNTLLNLAVSLKFAGAVSVLLAYDADPNRGNRYGWTPLHQAAYANSVEMAQELLDAGATPSVSARGDGGTPLVQALFWGHRAVAALLAAVEVTPLNMRVAAGLGRVDLLQGCFDGEGALRPEAGYHREYYRPHSGFPHWAPTDSPTEILDEALVYAARSGRLEALEFLLPRCSGVDAQPYNGTSLLWACANGDVDTASWLLEHGADVNRHASMGGEPAVTPLHVAAWHNRPLVARLLLSRGADLQAVDGRHQANALGWARHCGSKDVEQVLVMAQ